MPQTQRSEYSNAVPKVQFISKVILTKIKEKKMINIDSLIIELENPIKAELLMDNQ